MKVFFENNNLSLKPGDSEADLDQFMAKNLSFSKRRSFTSLFSTVFYAVLYVITFGRYTRPKTSLSSSHNFSRYQGEYKKKENT